MKPRQRVRTYALVALIALSIFALAVINYPEPMTRRLNWLRCPGASAIYTRGHVEYWRLMPGSIRLEVVAGSLYFTTIKVSTWNDVSWTNETELTLPIYQSTNFWVANDVDYGETVHYLLTNQIAQIYRIGYDGVDEADEGNSFQVVVGVRSIMSDNNQFVGRYVVECGLVTSWFYEYHNGDEDNEFYRLHATNIFLGVYNMFTVMLIIIAVYAGLMVFIIGIGGLIHEGIRHLRNSPTKTLK